MSRLVDDVSKVFLAPVVSLVVMLGCGGGGGGPECTVASTCDPPVTPAVTAAIPATSFRDVSIDVRLSGSNFVSGSRAVWRRNGTTDTTFAATKVKTNSTSFVSTTELLASITIQADARLGSYDVLVVTPGNAAVVGTQKFQLKLEVEQIDLAAGDNSGANGVNGLGQIVGTRLIGGAERAFLWQNGAFTDLGVLPGMAYSQATAVNASGTVVGFSGTENVNNPSTQRAFVWTAGGGLVALPSLGGTITYAHAINDNGDIVGGGNLAGDVTRHGVIWRAGVVTDIQLPLTGASGTWDINSSLEVAGWHDSRAARWTAAGGLQDLVMAGGTSTGLGNALGINDAGQIVGWRRLTGGSSMEAFVSLGASSVNILGLTEGAARAINNRGQVVGTATSGGQGVAFLWTESDGASMFGAAVGGGAIATSLNESGWIVGVRANRATLWKVK